MGQYSASVTVPAMWKTSSGDVKFTLDEIEFLRNSLRDQFKRSRELRDTFASKDTECECVCSSYLHGISNGEYFYAAYQVLNDMCADEPAREQPLWKQAVLISILAAAKAAFLNNQVPEAFEETAAKAWSFWEACRSKGCFPQWEMSGILTKPPTANKTSGAAWGIIFEQIFSLLVTTPELEHTRETFALADSQPHWPTFQECRRSRAWLLKQS